MLKWMLGIGASLLLLSRPEAAANGAREAMAQWYYAIAPSLFPFMALMPLLTCAEAASIYEHLLGGIMKTVYDLPGAAAPALVAGMLAGSPAGCMAARNMALRAPMTRGQFQRLAIGCCGLSPAFIISSVGAGVLGSAEWGHVLLRSQIATQMLLPLLLRPFFRDKSPVEGKGEIEGVRAVSAILNVCGLMMLFGALSAAIGSMTTRSVGRISLSVMDINSGVRIIGEMSLPMRHKLVLLSALTGFGGLCVCLQNMMALRNMVRPSIFIVGRMAAVLLSAAITVLQTSQLSVKCRINPLGLTCLFVCLMLIPVLYRLKRTVS